MNPSKEDIIESLHKIMCSATSTVSDRRVTNNDYFKRRVLGFKAEIEFENYIKSNSKIRFLDGGQLISKKLSGKQNDKNDFIYVTISHDDPNDYLNIYKTIARWSEIRKLIYIQIQLEDWETQTFEIRNTAGGNKLKDEILKPRFIFYIYDSTTNSFGISTTKGFTCVLENFNETNRSPSLFPLRKREQFEYFNEYNLDILKKIYANRYFLDLIMRQAQGRQIIDLDGFLENLNSLIVVEIKEKTPIKDTRNVAEETSWKYGWDSRRILWYLYLQNKIELNILYNVHQIDNRDTRNFIQWDSIYINDFLRGVSWSNSRSGGGGEDTLLAPFLFFKRLPDIIENLETGDNE